MSTLIRTGGIMTLLLVFIVVGHRVLAETCQMDNDALRAMREVEIVFQRLDGTQFSYLAKHANNSSTRAAGFQYVCADRIRTTSIVFTFGRELMAQFHMNNVVAPLDIAFIDNQGRIESLQTMQTYSILLTEKPLYGPSRPVVAALETYPGFFQDQEIDLSKPIALREVASLSSSKQSSGKTQ